MDRDSENYETDDNNENTIITSEYIQNSNLSRSTTKMTNSQTRKKMHRPSVRNLFK